MIQSSVGKERLLRIQQIMKNATKKNPFNSTKISEYLKPFNIKADRKTIADDISTLQACDYPIIQCKSKRCGWYTKEEEKDALDFTEEEARIITDLLSSSAFLSKSVKDKMIAKVLKNMTQEFIDIVVNSKSIDFAKIASAETKDNGEHTALNDIKIIMQALKENRLIKFNYRTIYSYSSQDTKNSTTSPIFYAPTTYLKVRKVTSLEAYSFHKRSEPRDNEEDTVAAAKELLTDPKELHTVTALPLDLRCHNNLYFLICQDLTNNITLGFLMTRICNISLGHKTNAVPFQKRMYLATKFCKTQIAYESSDYYLKLSNISDETDENVKSIKPKLCGVSFFCYPVLYPLLIKKFTCKIMHSIPGLLYVSIVVNEDFHLRKWLTAYNNFIFPRSFDYLQTLESFFKPDFPNPYVSDYETFTFFAIKKEKEINSWYTLYD